MTDKEIIELAKETLKEKYCKLYRGDGCPCEESCPLLDIVDVLHCEETIYITAFLDGFKAAMELVKNRAAEVRKWYEDNNDFNYGDGAEDALDDIIEAIER